MGEIQLILECLSVLKFLLLCFSPLIPFLYFELFSKLITKNDNNDDFDFDSGINDFFSNMK